MKWRAPSGWEDLALLAVCSPSACGPRRSRPGPNSETEPSRLPNAGRWYGVPLFAPAPCPHPGRRKATPRRADRIRLDRIRLDAREETGAPFPAEGLDPVLAIGAAGGPGLADPAVSAGEGPGAGDSFPAVTTGAGPSARPGPCRSRSTGGTGKRSTAATGRTGAGPPETGIPNDSGPAVPPRPAPTRAPSSRARRGRAITAGTPRTPRALPVLRTVPRTLPRSFPPFFPRSLPQTLTEPQRPIPRTLRVARTMLGARRCRSRFPVPRVRVLPLPDRTV